MKTKLLLTVILFVVVSVWSVEPQDIDNNECLSKMSVQYTASNESGDIIIRWKMPLKDAAFFAEVVKKIGNDEFDQELDEVMLNDLEKMELTEQPIALSKIEPPVLI